MELKLTLLLLSAVLLVELSTQRHLKAGGPKVGTAARTTRQLCGADLKRAVVTLCGGSRRKREEMEPSPTDTIETDGSKVLENVKLQSDPEQKEPQGNGPQAKEPSWSDFIEYYLDENRNIPEIKDDPAWSSEQRAIQHDHVPNTEPYWEDFFDLNNDNKEHTAAGAEDGEQESPDANSGSDFPQAKAKRKRDTQSEVAAKCCNEGCTGEEVTAVFCSK